MLWWPGSQVFSLIPKPLYSLRSFILKVYGSKIGFSVHISNTAKITFPWNLSVGDYTAIGDRVVLYNLGPMKIGKNVTVSQGVHLCGGSHDYRSSSFTLLKCSILVEDDAWIAADAFIGPNVSVGRASIVAARTCLVKSIPPNQLYAGNPARFIKSLDERDVFHEI